MTQIGLFSADEINVMAALFVQAAMNVSHAEDEDGESDDALEMRALDSGLREVVSDLTRPEIVRNLAKAAIDGRKLWDTWSQGVFNIEPICIKAMTLLKTQATKDEAREYTAAVVDVATSVAQAYGEFGIDAEVSSGTLDAAMKKIFSVFGKKNESNHPMNISPAEDACLKTISNALKNA